MKSENKNQNKYIQKTVEFTPNSCNYISFNFKAFLLNALFFVSLCGLVFTLIFGQVIAVKAQNLPLFNQSNTNLVDIDKQTQAVKEGQLSVNELKDKIKSLESETKKLQNEAIELKQYQATIEAKIKGIEETITQTSEKIKNNSDKITEKKEQLESKKQISDQNQAILSEISLIENEILTFTELSQKLENDSKRLNQELQAANLELNKTKEELIKKQSVISGNESAIKEFEIELSSKNEKLQNQTQELAGEVIRQSQQWLYYGLVLFFLWVLYRIVGIVLNNTIKNNQAVNIAKSINTFVWLGFSAIIIIYALAGRFTSVLTSLSFVSAALVIVSQHFIQSFVSFIIINLSKQFVPKDIIKLNGIVGQVQKIGFFNLHLKEISEENSMVGQYTGRTVVLPNNLFQKEACYNYTKNNRIIWYTFSITLDPESNLDKAREILEKILNDQFNWALDHRSTYLDDVYNLKNTYKPKIHFSIGHKGPSFNYNVAIRYGKYLEVSEGIYKSIISQFKENNIKIKYE